MKFLWTNLLLSSSPSQPYFIPNFWSSERPFWIGRSLKQFELGLNLFEFEIESDLNRCRTILWSGLACQWPMPHSTMAGAHMSTPLPGSPVSVVGHAACARRCRATAIPTALFEADTHWGPLSCSPRGTQCRDPPSLLPLSSCWFKRASAHRLRSLFPPFSFRSNRATSTPSSLSLMSTLGHQSLRHPPKIEAAAALFPPFL
jgi:hypothetical protein